MKNPKFLALLLFSACYFLVSCEEEPIASFTVSSTLVGTNQSVNFTNSSSDADHYEWFFGDGSSSTSTNPSHSYSQEGGYIVTLIAYSKSGRKIDEAYHIYLWVIDPYEVIFHNPTHTPINIEVTGYGSATIPIDGTVTYEVYTTTPSFTATGQETFSNGNPLALGINWSGTLNLTNTTSNIVLNVGTNFFYLYTKNSTGSSLGPIYTNYGNATYQIQINATLPTNYSTFYKLGYHHALSNTQIRWYLSGTSSYYYATAGTHFNFANTNNQYLEFTLSSKSTETEIGKGDYVQLIPNPGLEIQMVESIEKPVKDIPGAIHLFPDNQ